MQRWVWAAALWLNAVEGFFSIITRKRLLFGPSVTPFQDEIKRLIREHKGSA